ETKSRRSPIAVTGSGSDVDNVENPMRRDVSSCSHWSAALLSESKTVSERPIQLGNRMNLANGLFQVVFDTPEGDAVVVEQDVTCPPVAVARLAHRSDIDQRLVLIQGVDLVHFLWADKPITLVAELFEIDAWNVRVALE